MPRFLDHDITDCESKILDEPSKSGIIKAHVAVFGNEDLGRDIIDAGAFKKTIREQSGIWPILKGHDWDSKTGFNLKAKEDDKGLATEHKLAIDIVDGAELLSLSQLAFQVGAKDPMSIGFIPIQFSFEQNKKKQQIRRIKEIKMMEHSHVTFAMNPEAFTDSIKQWRQSKDLGLGDRVDDFFRHMEKIGYNEKEIKEALNRAAVAKSDPVIIQSVAKALKILKGETYA